MIYKCNNIKNQSESKVSRDSCLVVVVRGTHEKKIVLKPQLMLSLANYFFRLPWSNNIKNSLFCFWLWV